uniref:Uncharacterized protein n=1 Tax=Branchiostoma floridae TaxID=7739 RepID=C3XS96_BRAFL|eukprot:XP_002613102.1 hypothetical protein BRAFLDRAFT_89986 [Branchiostoma floridae]
MRTSVPPSPHRSTGRSSRRVRGSCHHPPEGGNPIRRYLRPGSSRRNHATPPGRNNRASRAAAPSTRGKPDPHDDNSGRHTTFKCFQLFPVSRKTKKSTFSMKGSEIETRSI